MNEACRVLRAYSICWRYGAEEGAYNVNDGATACLEIYGPVGLEGYTDGFWWSRRTVKRAVAELVGDPTHQWGCL